MIEPRLIEGTVVHTVAHFCLELARKIWAKPLLSTPAIFGLAVLISAIPFIGGIRSFFVLYLIVALLLSYRHRNFFIGFFLTFIFTLQFVHPNKVYSIEIIRGSEILERLYSEGYEISYFFHLATFFFVLSSGALIRELVLKRQLISRLVGTVTLSLTGVWLLFLLVAAYSISRYSPYSHLSLVWLFQYSFMYYVAIGVFLGLTLHPKFKTLLFATLGAIICTQFGVSILQLMAQRSAGLPFEATSFGSFATGLDENNAVFRVMGSFMFPNQLSFVMGVLVSLLLPYGLQKKSIVYTLIAVTAFLTIALTQTRSIMLSSLIVCFLNFRTLFADIRALVQKVGTQRVVFIGLAAFMLSAFSLIPRVLLSVNTSYAGAGLAIRVRMFKEAGEAIIANPWIGYGVGTNEYVLHKLFPDGVMSVFPAVVHMAYLQLWMEIGLFGLAVLLLPFLYLFRFTVVSTKQHFTQRFYRLGYIGGLVTILIFWLLLPHIGIVEFPFVGLVLGFGAYWYYLCLSHKRKT